jgi:hypothetical protein
VACRARPRPTRGATHRLISSRGSITLGELVGKLDMLEVACGRCDRRGRLSLERLITEHGADTGLPDLWGALAGDCPRARAVTINDRCGVHFPQLPALFPAPPRPRD